jgi:hypothetical protein
MTRKPNQQRLAPRRKTGSNKRGNRNSNFQDNVILTLSVEASASGTGTAALNNSSFLWQNFYDFVQLSEVYHYFRPVSYQLLVILDTTVMRWDGIFGFFPVNSYLGETPLTGTPADIDDIAEMRGCVLVQPQYRNIGKWTSWPKGVPQIPAFQARGDSIGNFLGYANNTVTGTLTLQLKVMCHFWERQPNFSVGKTLTPFSLEVEVKPKKKPFMISDTSEITDDKSPHLSFDS